MYNNAFVHVYVFNNDSCRLFKSTTECHQPSTKQLLSQFLAALSKVKHFHDETSVKAFSQWLTVLQSGCRHWVNHKKHMKSYELVIQSEHPCKTSWWMGHFVFGQLPTIKHSLLSQQGGKRKRFCTSKLWGFGAQTQTSLTEGRGWMRAWLSCKQRALNLASFLR